MAVSELARAATLQNAHHQREFAEHPYTSRLRVGGDFFRDATPHVPREQLFMGGG